MNPNPKIHNPSLDIKAERMRAEMLKQFELVEHSIISKDARFGSNVSISPFVNIWGAPIIGNNVKIGAFTEIGDDVIIGNNVTIGAYCFIPPGVTIEDNAWIGPRVTFSNDMYPPSEKKEHWLPTLIKKNAVLSASVSIRPGVVVGEGAFVGIGAVVIDEVPDNERWIGFPAKQLVSRGEFIYEMPYKNSVKDF
jgi:acetyltransferase-like isoleucine patch superfamily enzyme